MPIVSIVIPAYNCCRFIDRCLESLAVQTLDDWEAIVVDDGSTDSTRHIAEKWAAREPRIRVIAQANSGMPSIARNVGIKQASGEFLGFLDADDFLEPEKFAIQVKEMDAHADIVFSFHNVRLVDEEGNPLDETFYDHSGYLARCRECGHLFRASEYSYLSSPSFYGFISAGCTGIHTSSVFFRRNAVDKGDLRFAEDLVMGEDDDLWFRIAHKYRILLIDKELSSYRQNPAGVSHAYERALNGSIATHTRNLDRARHVFDKKQLGDYRLRIARQLRYLGYFYFKAGRLAESRKCYMESIGMKWTWRTVLHLCKSFVPNILIKISRGHRCANGSNR